MQQGAVFVFRFQPATDSSAMIRKAASADIQKDGLFEAYTRNPGDGVFLAAALPPPPGPDPELAPPAVLARPVPLVVAVERDGKPWLLRSGARNVALTLDSLRQLRRVPGLEELRLRVDLPAAIERKQRYNRA